MIEENRLMDRKSGVPCVGLSRFGTLRHWQTEAVTAKSTHLKLYKESALEAALGTDAGAIQSLPRLLRAFETATGKRLDVVQESGLDISDESTWKLNLGAERNPSTYLRVTPVEGGSPSIVADRDARRLAKAVGKMVEELSRTQIALRKREAELATGIPVVQHPDEEAHLAERLQAVLKGGLDAVHCDAAAVYLLDDATTQLKLRAAYGLPADRLIAPARPLAEALADLEALLGHAVVFEARDVTKHWNLPEDYPSAVCVPISTPTTILGTLWFFDTKTRLFDKHDTNLIEVIAGRVAADLEREVLMREGVHATRLKNQIAAAERRQRNALPTSTPLYQGWETAGWVFNAEPVGGDFYDWFPLPGKKLALALGDAAGKGVEAAMSAAALKTAFRSHANYLCDTKCLLERSSLTLWTGSSGDQRADFFCGMAHLDTGLISYSMAGEMSAAVLRANGTFRVFFRRAQPVGQSPEPEFRAKRVKMNPGDTLIVFSAGIRDLVSPANPPEGEYRLLETLRQIGPDRSVVDWIETAKGIVEEAREDGNTRDMSLLVIRRRFESVK